MTDWRSIAAHLADDADVLLNGKPSPYSLAELEQRLQESIDAFDAATKAAEDALATELEASR